MTAAHRVLVIDDSPEYRQIISDLAISQGWQVRACEDGASGLREARREPPDLIVTDLALGDTDGFSVCREIRSDEALRRVPVLMVTGTYRMEEDRLRGTDAGADAYLLKPFDLLELLETAKALLAKGK